MAWTKDDLSKLESAMAEGARVVEYKDKKIEYRSVREMATLRNLIKKELGLTKKSLRVQANFDKGLG